MSVSRQLRRLLPLLVLALGLTRILPAADTPAKDAPKGSPTFWIWGADDNKRYFLRKEFTAGSTSAALLRATCDNRMVIFLNGKEVARSDTWQSPVTIDVQKHLKADKNAFLVEVINDGGVAGFVLRLGLTDASGKTHVVATDETWEAAEKKDAEKWVAARKVGKLGDAPWGNIFSGAPVTTAKGGASGEFKTLPGFKVEKLFTVPKPTHGSWVSITTDNKGRLIVSDQDKKGLFRVTPPPIGKDEPTKVEPIEAPISSAQGLLWAFDSLYVSVNGGPGSGLYRVRSRKNDDKLDEVVKLKAIRGGGEHGPHGLRLSPDGKSIYLVCGNHTQPPENFNASRIRSNWAEDLLLPRQWDANGHARGILAPGGYICKTDPEGKTWEMVSIGYRNAYDIAFNADGELFSYDSDMEWDMGAPWYRPTRLTHSVSGSEFGWRSGTGVWPAYYHDSLPPTLDIGPGSPVGMEFGYGAKFPAKYQKALFCCDWTFGTMYAMHLEPHGATYKAVKEEFLSRTPLPLTDVVIAPDGAMYFTIGGRGTQSELFRVTYVGTESTERVEYKTPLGLRELRHKLEAYHQPTEGAGKAVDEIYLSLGHLDRSIRYAAWVALEHQPIALWQDRVLADTDPTRLITGAVAVARQGDKAIQGKLLAALDRVDFTKLRDEAQQLELLRAYQLAFIRLGEPDKDTMARLAKKFDVLFPAKSDPLNRELVQLLVYLKSPTIITKTMALVQQESKPPSAQEIADLIARNPGYGGPIAKMMANGADLQKFYYVFVLRNVREGWTLEQRKLYFAFLNEARTKSGGASYQGFINNLEKDAFDNTTDADRLAIEAAGLRKPFKPKELPKAQGPGRDWKLDELVSYAEPKLKGRDFKNGQKMYSAARCVLCHRFNGEGGATGPDLTQVAGRFSLKDLSESIVEPSKVISDQYKASIVATNSGKIYTGRIVSEGKDTLVIVIDPEDSTKVVEVKKSDVEEIKTSPVSLMPDSLLKQLNENEVLDLLAYLLSRGDPQHPMFKK